jgi:hypothetical protein
MALTKELQILSKSKEEKDDDDGRYHFKPFLIFSYKPILFLRITKQPKTFKTNHKTKILSFD